VITETPELYREIVKPCFPCHAGNDTGSFDRRLLSSTSDPPNRRSETSYTANPKWTFLCRTPLAHFLILPDMKWDPSGPDGHVGILEEIRERVYGVAKGRWGLPRGALRMYVHYQLSYHHIHGHHARVAGWHDGYGGWTGVSVGRYHLEGVSISSGRRRWLDLGTDHAAFRSSNTLLISCPSSR
jgi:m7GpppX diphosphatase